MPYLELSVALAFLSLPAVLVRLAPGVPIEAIGLWRCVIAAAALAPLAWGRRRAWAALSKRDRLLVPLCGLFFFVHLWLFTDAAQRTRVANCMLVFSVHPLLTALGARLAFGEPIRRAAWLGFALAAAGIWTLTSGSAAFGAGSLRGDAAALASAAAFSAYVLCGRHARRRLDNWSFAAVVYAATALCFLATGLARGTPFAGFAASSWLAIAGLGLGVTVMGHALFTHLFAVVDVHVLSLAKLLEPVGAAAIAYAAFGEALGWRAAAAFALIASAIALAVSDAPPRSGGSRPPA